MDGNALLMEVSASRVAELVNGQTAVLQPDGKLIQFHEMDEGQQAQVDQIKLDRPPDCVMYVWSIIATGPDGVQPPKDITPPPKATPATLGEWLKTGS